jgi:hypothetical protein
LGFKGKHRIGLPQNLKGKASIWRQASFLTLIKRSLILTVRISLYSLIKGDQMNQRYAVIALISSATLLAGCSTIKDTNLMQRQTLKNVESIQTDLAELRKEKVGNEAAQQLQKEKEQRIQTLRDMTTDNVARYTDFEAFLEIQLPEDPSETQVKDYIAAILATSKAQNSYNNEDLQVTLLTKLGRERLPIILDAFSQYASSNNDYRGRYHLKFTIQNLADASSRDAILGHFQDAPERARNEMFDLIARMNWEKEAKDILVAQLKEQLSGTSNYINNSLFDMLIKANDPETYPLLIEAVAKNSNFSYNFTKLSAVEGINQQELLSTAWKYRLNQNTQDQLFIAQYAAQEGDAFALDMLMTALTPNPRFRIQFDPRFAALAAIDFRGTNAEIQAWYNQNKAILTYDQKSGRFSALKSDQAIPAALTETE